MRLKKEYKNFLIVHRFISEKIFTIYMNRERIFDAIENQINCIFPYARFV